MSGPAPWTAPAKMKNTIIFSTLLKPYPNTKNMAVWGWGYVKIKGLPSSTLGHFTGISNPVNFLMPVSEVSRRICVFCLLKVTLIAGHINQNWQQKYQELTFKITNNKYWIISRWSARPLTIQLVFKLHDSPVPLFRVVTFQSDTQ